MTGMILQSCRARGTCTLASRHPAKGWFYERSIQINGIVNTHCDSGVIDIVKALTSQFNERKYTAAEKAVFDYEMKETKTQLSTESPIGATVAASPLFPGVLLEVAFAQPVSLMCDDSVTACTRLVT